MISKDSYAQLEGLSRHRKANKIIFVLNEFIDLSKCNVLDIGVGSGHISSDIAKKSKSLFGVDMYDERVIKSGYSFKKVNTEHLPFDDNKFDVVISNHVIEHVPNQVLHVEEIFRVLKKNGIFYLATPNKYWFIDPHSKLPFISWFPRQISSFYMKLFKNKKWDVYPVSYRRIERLANNRFKIYNISLEIMKNPKKYNLDIFSRIQFLLKLIPGFILNFFSFIVPTYILILKKK